MFEETRYGWKLYHNPFTFYIYSKNIGGYTLRYSTPTLAGEKSFRTLLECVDKTHYLIHITIKQLEYDFSYTPYRYSGNRTRTICKNGHFGISESECNICDESRVEFNITNRDGESVFIDGYLSKNNNAVLKSTTDTQYEIRSSLFRNYTCDVVSDFIWELTVDRLFHWGLCTF